MGSMKCKYAVPISSLIYFGSVTPGISAVVCTCQGLPHISDEAFDIWLKLSILIGATNIEEILDAL